MSLDLATAAVEWMATRNAAAGRENLEIHFFGGEPFVAPDVVETSVHYARSRAGELGLRTRFEVSTNGCFSERCRTFIADYFDAVVLSFDGPEEVQKPASAWQTGQEQFCQGSSNRTGIVREPG